jgi:tetratricopeptide (TPR) repeat protein
MDRSGVLQPLDEAAGPIRRLQEYRSPAELGEAVAAVVAAIDRSLRLALRADREAPEAHRLGALSPDVLSLEQVVQSLRTRDVIALETAGALHALKAAAARASTGEVQAADGDVAERAVDRLRADLAAWMPAEPTAGTEPTSGPPEPVSGPEPGQGPPEPGSPDSPPERRPPPPRTRGFPPARWMAWIGVAFAVLFMIGLAWVLAGGGDEDFDRGVAAFRAARWDSAAAAFERVLADRPVDVTAMMYLARSYRRQGRLNEAADVLREAVRAAPDDPAVRRELGHLFMDLDQPGSAIAQYERALEHDPASTVAWTRLIHAMRAAGDPRAAEVLGRAPPEVRATFDPGAR